MREEGVCSLRGGRTRKYRNHVANLLLTGNLLLIVRYHRHSSDMKYLGFETTSQCLGNYLIYIYIYGYMYIFYMYIYKFYICICTDICSLHIPSIEFTVELCSPWPEIPFFINSLLLFRFPVSIFFKKEWIAIHSYTFWGIPPLTTYSGFF